MAGRAVLILQATVFVGAILGVAGLSDGLFEIPVEDARQTVALPPADADLEAPLQASLDELRKQDTDVLIGGRGNWIDVPNGSRLAIGPGGGVGGGFASGSDGSRIVGGSGGGAVSGEPRPPRWSSVTASDVAKKLKSYNAEYNKPRALHLGETTSVQLVIPVNRDQDLFKGLDGDVTFTTMAVADTVSAKLTGTPDQLEITLRNGEMKNITGISPVTWFWDVKPLKPGKTTVTLEVTSYIETGRIKTTVPIRVLQDTWIVEARGFEWVKYQIEQIAPVQAFVFGLGGPVAAVLAWLGIKGFGGKKREFES
jgi:hypothetical protein